MRLSACLSLFPAVLALLAPQVHSLSVTSPTDDSLPGPNAEQLAALEALNGFRAIHGLEPVTLDRRLMAAAKQHARSMAESGSLSHSEDRALAKDALERAMSYGYDKGVGELLASGVADAPTGIVAFVEAPYHRRILLKPGKFDFGCSSDSGYVCFVLGGKAEARVVLSPPQGATGIPTTWKDREYPDPMRGTGLKAPFGFPIMIAAFGDGELKVSRFTIAPSGGAALPCVLRQPLNDPEAHNCGILIPKRPLAGNTVYTVTAEYNVGDDRHSETWSFRTARTGP